MQIEMTSITNEIWEVNREAKNANTIFRFLCRNLYPKLSGLNCGTVASLEDNSLKDKMTKTRINLQSTSKDWFM